MYFEVVTFFNIIEMEVKLFPIVVSRFSMKCHYTFILNVMKEKLQLSKSSYVIFWKFEKGLIPILTISSLPQSVYVYAFNRKRSFEYVKELMHFEIGKIDFLTAELVAHLLETPEQI